MRDRIKKRWEFNQTGTLVKSVAYHISDFLMVTTQRTYLDKMLFLLSQVHGYASTRRYPATYVNRNLLLARSRVMDPKDHVNLILIVHVYKQGVSEYFNRILKLYD